PLPSGETEDTRRIVERFGEDVIAAGEHLGQQIVYIKPAKLVELARFLKEDPQLAYEACTDVTAVDRSKLPIAPEDPRFETVYQLRSYSRKRHLMVICPLENNDEPSVQTLAPVYSGAAWAEREVLDLMGITFIDHPDPRRIMMPPNWPYHPLRKN